MNHYECRVFVGRRTADGLRWRYVREYPPVLIDARSQQEAKQYMRRNHPPTNMRPGEVVSSIKARRVPTAYVMEELNQKRLL